MTDAAASKVRALLADRAFLFEDAGSYMAGVDEALHARHTSPATTHSGPADAWPLRPLLDGRGQE